MVKNSVLAIKNVSFYMEAVERPILNDIEYSIQEGDYVIVLGGNGSGKSSLIKLINSTYPIHSGNILLNGKKLSEWKRCHFHQSMVTFTQDVHLSLFDDLSVLENCVMWNLRHKKVSFGMITKRDKKQFEEYLQCYHPNLSSKLDLPVKRLSGGEKQALILGLCLIHPPVLLLLDEHTSAMDPKAAHKLMQRTHEAIRAQKITCIMTTHCLEDALVFGNRLIALKDGKIIFQADGPEKLKLSRADLLEFCY